MPLIDELIKDGWLKTPAIIDAFRKIKRADFMPEDSKNLSELNEAMAIGFNQTISQPLTVAFMIELLQPKPGDNILDIGSGSGWTTALLAYCVSQQTQSAKRKAQNHSSKLKAKQGLVIAVEIIPELMEFGKNNTAKYNFIKKGVARFICADGTKGYKQEAPYNRILASASARKLPAAWKQQLKVKGRIVAPIENSIWLFEKINDNEFKEIEHPGFAFVPLVNKR